MRPASRIYLDANVLIYLTEFDRDKTATLRALIGGYELAQAEFITSELAYTEVLVRPIRAQHADLILAYERLLTVFVKPLPVSRDVLCLAAKLRAGTPAQKTPDRTPDAIHVATAMLANADVFVTGDKDIKNLPTTMTLKLVAA